MLKGYVSKMSTPTAITDIDKRLDKLERALAAYLEHGIENAHARSEAKAILDG